jgi:hypothetical protein
MCTLKRVNSSTGKQKRSGTEVCLKGMKEGERRFARVSASMKGGQNSRNYGREDENDRALESEQLYTIVLGVLEIGRLVRYLEALFAGYSMMLPGKWTWHIERVQAR